ncbi:MAG: DUF465 domain-containing protein [Sphingomonadaceae bacterium]|nr:DUF465 domain-containing protein [Sphingomonadaceae bacterium]MCB2086884.1 DUF465 domain-containing protein [Sphingomonadaceae bacterium]MCP5383446.1 DUF465 domain-containing protein [Altererythrobacter sp.]MCP5394388.1 DUF465 domain-containing protein [Sphingomonadaceae bacterium]
MSHTPHELADEFPQDHELLHKLKLEDAHFVTLSDRYHKVNREIHRIETEVEPASDDYVEMLKKQRLALIDQIGKIIAAARAAA